MTRPIPAAGEAMPTSPSLRETINAYKAGYQELDRLAGLPGGLTKDNEEALWEELIHPHSKALIKWNAPAATIDEAISALQMVRQEEEGFSGSPIAGSLFRAALQYFETAGPPKTIADLFEEPIDNARRMASILAGLLEEGFEADMTKYGRPSHYFLTKDQVENIMFSIYQVQDFIGNIGNAFEEAIR
ncbi:hypothetical protein QO004_000485 [Rhizobium mesoamericanum]|uniref:hypothetical protein n=1 Tax=Rhizobium mesoamericanum TaxID=1079800 RepID=UPI00277FCD84|nr:hypothetical protein [Rhizobium mesoamericanum]MDQ0558710.1 hypothetical protein [Rhizobium mesoamericanum]